MKRQAFGAYAAPPKVKAADIPTAVVGLGLQTGPAMEYWKKKA